MGRALLKAKTTVAPPFAMSNLPNAPLFLLLLHRSNQLEFFFDKKNSKFCTHACIAACFDLRQDSISFFFLIKAFGCDCHSFI